MTGAELADIAVRIYGQQGQAGAQAAQQKGQILGGTIAGIGQMVGQIPAQQRAQQMQEMELQTQGLQNQALRGRLNSQQQAEEGQKQANALVASLPRKEDGTFDAAGVAELFAKNNVPLAVQQQALKDLDAINGVVGAAQQSRLEHRSAFANAVLSTQPKNQPISAEDLQLALEFGRNSGVTDTDIKAANTALAQGMEPSKILSQWLKPEKPMVLPRPGAQLVGPRGDVLATAPEAPEKPVVVAPGGTLVKPSTGQTLFTAPSKPDKPGSMDEQLLEAIAAGDTTKANQITQTLRTAAEARKDPAAVAQAAALRDLSRQEAQARLDALKEKAKPIDITADVQSTGKGGKYIDLSLYSAGERDKAREAANAAGVTPVSKEQGNALQEVDNARRNQEAILGQVKGLLPKDPQGRILGAPTRALGRIFQTNEQRAAFQSWRTAAIQTLRATAGSKGLRINQAEIAQAIENDIPTLNDTWGVAQQKVQNINTLLDSAEASILGTRNRETGQEFTVGGFKVKVK